MKENKAHIYSIAFDRGRCCLRTKNFTKKPSEKFQIIHHMEMCLDKNANDRLARCCLSSSVS